MTVEEQAALWVARLQSADASAADRAACTAWCAADPAHQQAYAAFRDLWTRMAAILPKSDEPFKAWQTLCRQLELDNKNIPARLELLDGALDRVEEGFDQLRR